MIIIAFAALIFSGILTYVIYRSVSGRVAPKAEETVQIVVAVERLPMGVRITPDKLRLAAWPKAVALEGSFSRIEDVADRGVVVPIFPNEPILETKLSSTVGLTATIPDGMRAVSVRVNDVTGVAGFAVPGTHVDVILTATPRGTTRSDPVSKVLLEDVLVLAAGQNIDQAGGEEGAQRFGVATLLVTPEDAQTLILAGQTGTLQLSLRNPTDLETVDPEPVEEGALFARTTPTRRRTAAAAVTRRVAPRRPPKPPEPVTITLSREVELIQGSNRSTHVFEEKVTVMTPPGQ
jgi:pilus assembly protein CpaB